MRVIVAGGRDYGDYEHVRAVLDSFRPTLGITEIVSGCAPGADTLGERWAMEHGIPVKPFPAKWKTDSGEIDRGAGFRRNEEMARYADCLIAFPGGRGTAHMIKRARRHGLKVYAVPDRKGGFWE